MRLGWVHYSIGSQSGVEMVMRRFARGLLAADAKLEIHFVGQAGPFIADWNALAPGRVSYTDLPEMALGVWAQTPAANHATLADELAARLAAELEGCDAVIIENAAVGAHPAFNLAVTRLLAGGALKKARFVFRAHDLAFSRPANFAAIKAFAAETGIAAHDLLFPRSKRALHLTVNRADAYCLYSLGLPEESIRYLPNPVDESLAGGGRLANSLRTEMERLGWVKPGEHLLIYPVRAVPRKNITEALLLTRLLNLLASGKGGIPHALQPDGPFRLLVAIQPEAGRDQHYVDLIGDFIAKNDFEAKLGLEELVGPVCRLRKGEQAAECFGVAELYAVSSAVVSTSVLEGFGFGFLEPWCAERVTIGRRVPVMDDFILAGMRMEHFYRQLTVNDRDFPHFEEPQPSVFAPVTNDFNEDGVHRRLQLVKELDSGHRLGHFLTENRWAVERMLEALVRPSRLVEHNREKAFAAFSLDKLTPRLAAAVRGEPDPVTGR
jgi:hypothetical protein